MNTSRFHLTFAMMAGIGLALGACGGGGGTPLTPAAKPKPVVMMPGPDVPPAPRQVTQIDAADDMMVMPVRDSDGDLKAVMVGETEISTIRFAQKTGDLDAGSTMFGVKAKNGGIEISHADAYVNKRPGIGARILAGADGDATDVADNIWIVEKIEQDDIVPMEDAIDLPLGAVITSSPLTGASNQAPRFPGTTAGTGAEIGLVFDTDDDATSPDVAPSFYRMIVKNNDGTDKMDELGQISVRYFMQVADDDDPVGPSGTPLDVPQVIELNVVMDESKMEMVREKDASPFKYLSYGAWAEIDSDKKLTALGNGYLFASEEMMTPAANMPVTGTATFEGQYASYVWSKGSRGTIRARAGDAEMTANFGRSSMSVNLVDQFGEDNDLTLTGTIDGGMFAGTGVKDFKGSMLQPDGATAKLEGAFYGMKVDEAGGVYDVLGGAKTNPGRVVGAFGGTNTGN